MEGADDAAERLGKRTIEEFLRAVLEQAILFHDLGNQNRVLRIAAAVFERIAGGHQRSVIRNRRLNGEFFAGRELVRPLRADLFDHAAEFMADDRRMLRDVLRNALMLRALNRSLIAGHTYRIGNNLHENLIIMDLGKLERIQTQIIFSVHSNGLG